MLRVPGSACSPENARAAATAASRLLWELSIALRVAFPASAAISSLYLIHSTET
jgi:hypothetical protein